MLKQRKPLALMTLVVTALVATPAATAQRSTGPYSHTARVPSRSLSAKEQRRLRSAIQRDLAIGELIRRLDARLAEIDANIGIARRRRSRLDRELVPLGAQRKRLDLESAALSAQIFPLEARAAELEDAIARTEARIADLRAGRRRGRIVVLGVALPAGRRPGRPLGRASRRLAELRAEYDAVCAQLIPLRERAVVKQRRLERVTARLQPLWRRAREIEADIAKAQRRAEKVSRRRENLVRESDELRARIARLKRQGRGRSDRRFDDEPRRGRLARGARRRPGDGRRRH